MGDDIRLRRSPLSSGATRVQAWTSPAGRDDWRGTETSPELIDARWRELRQHIAGAARQARKGHLAHYAAQLSIATDRNSGRAVTDLLAELSEVHGVAWADIAAALGISVPALRKWRKSTSGTTPENHRKLAQLVAFFGVLSKLVDSSARWMSMPMVDGYNVLPLDVYSPTNAARLLDLAVGNAGVTPTAVLDDLSPGWRAKWLSKYEVFEAADGELSMRPRQG